ncbi:glycosyltransferase family 9 protein [Gemmatimonas sp.]
MAELTKRVLVNVDAWVAPLVLGSARAVHRRRVTVSDGDRPLVIRPGGLGDLVVATAASEILGIEPRSLDWLIERRSEVWARSLGLRYYCYDRPRDLISEDLRRSRRLIINLEQRYGLAGIAARLLAAPSARVISFRSNLMSHDATESADYDPLDEHELKSFVRIFAQSLGVSERASQPRSRTAPATGLPVLALAGSGCPSRRLRSDQWAAFIDRIVPSGNLQIISAPADYALAQAIAQRVGTRAVAARLSWTEIVEQVRVAPRVLTIDGGMVHVASYFGTPVTALFTAGRHLKWSPWSAGSTVIRRSDLSCQPCTVFGRVANCPIDYACRFIDLSALPENQP